jgi:hypothetical protein
MLFPGFPEPTRAVHVSNPATPRACRRLGIVAVTDSAETPEDPYKPNEVCAETATVLRTGSPLERAAIITVLRNAGPTVIDAVTHTLLDQGDRPSIAAWAKGLCKVSALPPQAKRLAEWLRATVSVRRTASRRPAVVPTYWAWSSG